MNNETKNIVINNLIILWNLMSNYKLLGKTEDEWGAPTSKAGCQKGHEEDLKVDKEPNRFNRFIFLRLFSCDV